jgi:hypothetical protein
VREIIPEYIDDPSDDTPPYVYDLVRALTTGEPLNFQAHKVPESVQKTLEQAVKDGKLGFVTVHACQMEAQRDVMAFREQYLVRCRCHSDSWNVWQPGDEPKSCSAGTVYPDPRTLLRRNE